MSVAHFGIGLFTLGVTLVSAFNVEEDIALRPGQTVEVAHYRFELREVRDVQGPNYAAIEGVVEVREGADYVGELRPQKRQYLVQKNWMTEAGILALWNQDIFVALGDQLGNDTWSVRIQYKPMIRLIWLGALVMALGGLIAISDRRYRATAKAQNEVRGAATESV
jgi:cytochrome c-type biogenesis protein CcmF